MVSIPQAVCTRCNLLRLPVLYCTSPALRCFNTASGMYALQRRITSGPGIRLSRFQYRKRYVRVATACLETRPQTGLKWQIGKPPRFFPLLPAVSVNTSSFLRHSYASIPVFMPVFVFTKKLENLFSNFPIL